MFNGGRTSQLRRSHLVLLLGLSLLLAACGQSTGPGDPGPGDPDPTDPDPSPAECRHVIDAHITIPTLLSNGPEECDYLVLGLINVTNELTIEAGTTVEFDQDSRLSVSDTGSIIAVGTPEERIELRGRLNVTGFWYGICFGTNRESRLENVNLLNAGKVWSGGSRVCRGGLSGVNGNGEPVHIVNTLVAGSQTTGMDATTFNLGEFSGNIFAANQEFGVRIDPGQLYLLDAGSDYLGVSVEAPNAKPYVWLGGGMEDPGFRNIWPRLNAEYYVGADTFPYRENVNIFENTTIQLRPGTVLNFGPDASLNFFDWSTLEVFGTAEEPVVFRGLEPVKGLWDGIYISNSAIIMEHAEIHWAGGASLTPGSIAFGGVDYMQESSIDHVLIRGSANCALNVSSYVHPLLTLGDNIEYQDNDMDYCGPA